MLNILHTFSRSASCSCLKNSLALWGSMVKLWAFIAGLERII